MTHYYDLPAAAQAREDELEEAIEQRTAEGVDELLRGDRFQFQGLHLGDVLDEPAEGDDAVRYLARLVAGDKSAMPGAIRLIDRLRERAEAMVRDRVRIELEDATARDDAAADD